MESMAVQIQPDVRIGRSNGNFFATKCAVLSMTCCGAELMTDAKTAPALAVRLERVHRCVRL